MRRQRRLAGYDAITETIHTDIEIINMTGEIVFAARVSYGAGCSTYLMKMNKKLVPGLYVFNMNTNGVRSSKHLLVRH